MADPTPADELRAAATLIRETAADANSELWDALFPDSRAPHIKATNAWIRLMSPAVAEPLAVLLEDLADFVGEFDKEPPAGHLIGKALAVARSILGEAAS